MLKSITLMSSDGKSKEYKRLKVYTKVSNEIQSGFIKEGYACEFAFLNSDWDTFVYPELTEEIIKQAEAQSCRYDELLANPIKIGGNK